MAIRRKDPALPGIRRFPQQLQIVQVIYQAYRPDFHVIWTTLSLTSGIPSPKYSDARSKRRITSPVSGRTFRSDDWPLRPVPSYRKPSRYARPWVYADVSWGNTRTIANLHLGGGPAEVVACPGKNGLQVIDRNRTTSREQIALTPIEPANYRIARGTQFSRSVQQRSANRSRTTLAFPTKRENARTLQNRLSTTAPLHTRARLVRDLSCPYMARRGRGRPRPAINLRQPLSAFPSSHRKRTPAPECASESRGAISRVALVGEHSLPGRRRRRSGPARWRWPPFFRSGAPSIRIPVLSAGRSPCG